MRSAILHGVLDESDDVTEGALRGHSVVHQDIHATFVNFIDRISPCAYLAKVLV
jgi:hypothetical protein